MKQKYDVFEKFSDGSTVWRDFVLGIETTHHRLQELSKKSKNRFYAINLTTGRVHVFEPGRDLGTFRAPLRSADKAKTQTA